MTLTLGQYLGKRAELEERRYRGNLVGAELDRAKLALVMLDEDNPEHAIARRCKSVGVAGVVVFDKGEMSPTREIDITGHEFLRY